MSEKAKISIKIERCAVHGQQKMSQEEVYKNLIYPRGTINPYDSVSNACIIVAEDNLRIKLYEHDKICLADFVERLRKSLADRASVGSAFVTRYRGSVKAPCGCTLAITLGEEISIEKEPRLRDVLLRLGLKTDADLRLVRQAFFPDEEESTRLTESVKRKADGIMAFMRAAEAELEALDTLADEMSGFLENKLFPYSELDQNILKFTRAEVEKAKTQLEGLMEAEVDELTSRILRREWLERYTKEG